MSEIVIRYLKRKDAPRVASFISHLTKNIVRPEEIVERIERLSIAECGILQGFQYFVAEEDGLVISFGGLVWYSIPSKGLMTWYEELVTDKKHEGKGAMKLLMKALDALAESLGSAQTKLTTSSAAKMYEKNGFTKKDEVLMVKKYY